MNRENDKPKPTGCKLKAQISMKLLTEAKLSEDGAREVWGKVADSFRQPLLFVGIGAGIAPACYGISLIKWW